MKLHEVVAIRKGIKSRTYGRLTQLFKEVQKASLFQGMKREYSPLDDDGESFPSENKSVVQSTEAILKEVRKLRVEFLDVEATQEYGNQQATADVVVNGTTILAGAPVTLLIHLEKELNDIHSFIEAMPTLDPDKEWSKDPNSHLYRSEPQRTHKTKKVQRPIVLYAATEHHPAQTQLITEDMTIGHWTTTHVSSALPLPVKEQYLERVLALQDAVKTARARANELDVPKQEVAGKLLDFIFQ